MIFDKNVAASTVQRPPALRPILSFVAIAAAAILSSCTTPSSPGRGSAGQLSSAAYNSPAVKQRNAMIATERPGDYYIGRRWWTEGTRFWGYVRRPGQPWSESKLVIMNESTALQPDRLPETGEGRHHGYDHNVEYRLWGSFTGQTAYDPNSNFVIPEFRLSKFEAITDNPGFLFYPSEGYNPRSLPPKHPPFPN